MLRKVEYDHGDDRGVEILEALTRRVSPTTREYQRENIRWEAKWFESRGFTTSQHEENEISEI